MASFSSNLLVHHKNIKKEHPRIIPVNPRSTQIWRRLEIFRGTKQASEGRGIEAKFEASLGGRGIQFIACFLYVPLPILRAFFAVAQNFTKRDPTITPATQATTFMKKKRLGCFFTGRFGGLTGRPGDLIKNLETPGKTGRVGRYEECVINVRAIWQKNYPGKGHQLICPDFSQFVALKISFLSYQGSCLQHTVHCCEINIFGNDLIM